VALFRSPVGTLRRRGFGGSRISPVSKALDSILVDIAGLARRGKRSLKSIEMYEELLESDGLQKWDEWSAGLITRLLPAESHSLA
jgi:hypothetical protein